MKNLGSILYVSENTDYTQTYEGNWGMKTFYLVTTVKCDMGFQDFPFDDHVCEIEVSHKSNNLFCYTS